LTTITKTDLAKAALDGAVAGIRHQYPHHIVECVTDEPLSRQVRVRAPGSYGGPRYFVIKVSEPL
jgi:hypothetical protein